MMMTDTVKRGDVYLIDMGKKRGHHQGGIRPGIIVSNDVGNRYSPNVTVVPLTGQMKKQKQPTHMPIVLKGNGKMRHLGQALCENIDTVDKRKLMEYWGRLDRATMAALDTAMAVQLGLAGGIKKDDNLIDRD